MTAGFHEANLLCKVKKRSASTAKDIIHEGNVGMYDAVILGRRGISRLEELINDSVSMRALDQDRISPLWICRKPELDRSNVLVGIDGSQPSLQIADHVGFMLKDQPGHDATLFAVNKKGAAIPDQALDQAHQAMLDNGFPEERIHRRTQTASDPAAAIEKEASSGRYAAVAVGSSGEAREGFFKIGSVSKKLCYSLSGATLMIG
jgi:nucleotide-binding universal stress UspA family protein